VLYTFGVQQDVAGIIHLFGGRQAFNDKLDRLFVEQYGTPSMNFSPSFQTPQGWSGSMHKATSQAFISLSLRLFRPTWKTQRRVRQLMDVWYGDGPLGIPGDDDGGETSSWYVLSALGFYPVCPGSPVYEIGSPIFPKL